MGIRMPGMGSGLIPPDMVDKLIEVQKKPVEMAKSKRTDVVSHKEEYQKLQTFINELDTVVSGLKTRGDFYKMKVESSHPDIIDGMVQPNALAGSYEFEVRGLATSEKELAYGFPDKDQTEVGFGYMLVEREDMDPVELTINPGSTLQDVASQINESNSGVRAMVVNTKYKPEGYRLLVVSEKSGDEAKITVDADTTFLDFKEQVIGRNLDVLFEDVPVTDEDNKLDELVDGVTFDVKRSEPGTRIQVNVKEDVDLTLTNIKSFVEKYNAIAKFVHDQFAIDEQTQKAGKLSAESSLRSVMRSLQGAFTMTVNTGGKFSTLAQVGITTNPKTGELNLDENKVKQALTDDYDSVAKLFIRTDTSDGISQVMADKIRGFKDPASGPIKSRMRTFDKMIDNIDNDIERKERSLTQKEQALRRQFASLESRLGDMKAQESFLQQRFGGGGGGGKG